MFSKVYNWIKSNYTAIVSVLAVVGYWLFNYERKQKDEGLLGASTDKKDAVLAQAQSDVEKQIADIQQQQKQEDEKSHSPQETVEGLKKL